MDCPAHGSGDREAIVSSPEWEGPAYETCMVAASVCHAFQTLSRRKVLTFARHQTVAALPEPDRERRLSSPLPVILAGQILWPDALVGLGINTETESGVQSGGRAPLRLRREAFPARMRSTVAILQEAFGVNINAIPLMQ